MKTLVQKFGGTSLASIELMQQAVNRIISARRHGYHIAVVVSAMGDDTDQLLALAKAANPALPAREYDMLLSSGEQKSVALLAMLLQANGVDAISLTGWQARIQTNYQHSHAKIIDISTEVINDHLAQDKVVVIAGFQGVTDEGEVTTLGRGGSDLSAVALAAALNAEECQIFTDVDGVYPVDPRIVATAEKIDGIAYTEMAAFAGAGAKVLHARSVILAEKLGVSLRVLSSFSEGSGTVISASKSERFFGVACQRQQALVTISSTEDLTSLIRRSSHAGLQINFSQHEEDVYHLLIPNDQVVLAHLFFAEVNVICDVEKRLSIITLVCSDTQELAACYRTATQGFANKGVDVLFQRDNDHQQSFVVEDQSAVSMVRGLFECSRARAEGLSVIEG